MTESLNHIRITEVIENDAALTPTAGDKVFGVLNSYLGINQNAILDFDGLTATTTAFLNACIGQLYAHYTSDFLNDHLKVINTTSDNAHLLIRVISRAKQYFNNKDLDNRIGNIINE